MCLVVVVFLGGHLKVESIASVLLKCLGPLSLQQPDGVLTIYTNHPAGEKSCAYTLTVKFDVVRLRNDPPQSLSKSTEQPKKTRKIALPQITGHVFRFLLRASSTVHKKW